MSDYPTHSERPAERGERCTCGRQAILVILGPRGETGWCGASDGGDRSGPCPFCGGDRHVAPWGGAAPCPDYRLRLECAGSSGDLQRAPPGGAGNGCSPSSTPRVAGQQLLASSGEIESVKVGRARIVPAEGRLRAEQQVRVSA